MSTYSTVQGFVEYTNRLAFDAVAHVLREGEWVDDEGFFIDEVGIRIDDCNDPQLDTKTLTIHIPYSCYCNLCRVEFCSYPDQIRSCSIVGSSTDGMNEGWVIDKPPGGELTETSHALAEYGDGPEPDADEDEDWDTWDAWIQDAEETFHRRHA